MRSGNVSISLPTDIDTVNIVTIITSTTAKVNSIKKPVFIPKYYTFETRQFDFKPRQDDKNRYCRGEGKKSRNGEMKTPDDNDNCKDNNVALKLEWKEIQGTRKSALFGKLHK